MYLTPQQMADLIGCRTTSYNCMKRWLDKNGWPYAVTISGFPKVSQTYHDAKMNGEIHCPMVEEHEPNFGALYGR